MEAKDYAFWKKSIAEAECIYDLFNISEELILELKVKVKADALVQDIALIAARTSPSHSDLLNKIEQRLQEFGAQKIRYMDWYMEISGGP